MGAAEEGGSGEAQKEGEGETAAGEEDETAQTPFGVVQNGV
jgi:hypothetical protein